MASCFRGFTLLGSSAGLGVVPVQCDCRACSKRSGTRRYPQFSELSSSRLHLGCEPSSRTCCAPFRTRALVAVGEPSAPAEGGYRGEASVRIRVAELARQELTGPTTGCDCTKSGRAQTCRRPRVGAHALIRASSADRRAGTARARGLRARARELQERHPTPAAPCMNPVCSRTSSGRTRCSALRHARPFSAPARARSVLAGSLRPASRAPQLVPRGARARSPACSATGWPTLFPVALRTRVRAARPRERG